MAVAVAFPRRGPPPRPSSGRSSRGVECFLVGHEDLSLRVPVMTGVVALFLRSIETFVLGRTSSRSQPWFSPPQAGDRNSASLSGLGRRSACCALVPTASLLASIQSPSGGRGGLSDAAISRVCTSVQEGTLRWACVALLQEPLAAPTDDVVDPLRLLHPAGSCAFSELSKDCFFGQHQQWIRIRSRKRCPRSPRFRVWVRLVSDLHTLRMRCSLLPRTFCFNCWVRSHILCRKGKFLTRSALTFVATAPS